MAQTAPRSAPGFFEETAPSGGPLASAEEIARFRDHDGVLDNVLVDLDLELRQDAAPSAWREARLDPEVVGTAWAVAKRALRANDPERAEIDGLIRVCFRHAMGAMLAGAMPRHRIGEQSVPAAPTPLAEALVLDDLADRHADLPARQDLMRHVAEAVAHPLSDAERVARAVDQDRVLAALVLRLVNSEFFGLAAPVRSLERAVTFLGLGEVQALVLAASALRTLAPDKEAGLERAWRRGLTCGVAARLVAKRLHLSGKWLLTAGLLLQAGELALEREAPEGAAAARGLAQAEGIPLDAAQKRIFGFDAAEAAGCLLDAWQSAGSLAGPTADLTANLHRPHLSQRPDQAAVLHLAVVLAHILDLADRGRVPAPVLDQQAWCGLCLPVSALPDLAGATLGERFGLLRIVRP